MKKVITVLLAAMMTLSAFALTACNPGVTGEAMGKVHKHYIGIAKITVNGDDVTAAKFDEVLTAYSWAGADPVKTDYISVVNPTDYATIYIGTPSPTGTNKIYIYSKFIQVDGINFSLDTTAGATAETAVPEPKYTRISGTPAIESLEQYIFENEGNMKWYKDAVAAGKYNVMKGTSESLTVDYAGKAVASKLGYGAKLLKSQGGYWPQEKDVPLGWKGNMEKMEKFIVEYDFGAYTTSYQKSLTDNNTFKVGEVDTGATLVDFNDYMKVAYTAYERAKA